MLKSKESFYENEEDASESLMSTMQDIVQGINVAQGAPCERTKKIFKKKKKVPTSPPLLVF
jgi:hypothetical protein